MPTTLQGEISGMFVADDVDELIEGYRRALDDCSKGEQGPPEQLLSNGEDAALADLYGLRVRGWRQIEEALEHATSFREQGEMVAIEVLSKYVTPGLVHAVNVERAVARVGGSKAIASLAQARR